MIRTFIHDTDNRRKEIVWLILALLAALGLALFLALYFGQQLALRTWDDAVMLSGLVVFLGCAIVYFAAKEREQRQLNQSLVESLRGAVWQLNQRVAALDDLTRTNDQLSDALSRAQTELNESYLAALRALMRTLDARDGYTARHGEQVTSVAVMIAERMGLERSLVEVLERFGPLHDIGKIGIPDDVLRKPGPLEPAEVALCQQHAALGETIVAPLRPGNHVLAMFRSHHERWDGQGYPDGLAGTKIPLLARILCVADSYHAMITQRPYQAARRDTQAVREMVANAGRQFDPDVVGVLAGLVCEGLLEPEGIR
jgi:HD-GYP domain-containing protein (c-di-GMP phosphodiesterase class II)